jgi:16S rRNA (guanine527-N7)-methyltransferase
MSRAAEAPLPAERFEELLRREAPGFRLSLDEETFDGLAAYLSDLDLWRRKANLTGDLPARDLVVHTLESVLGSTLIVQGERVVDIGSGAGFPGVPIAIARPDLSVVLVEPRLKRAAFLRHVVRTLPLANAAVREARIEDVREQTFDAATTRAVGQAASVLSGAFLRPGGALLLWTTQSQTPGHHVSSIFRLETSLEIPGSREKIISVWRKRKTL